MGVAAKLHRLIALMKERSLSVLFLSETRSTSYHYFLSEGYLCYFNGSPKQKGAGVGAIIAPAFRPYLLDVKQFSERLIQLRARAASGQFHLWGTYPPHQGDEHDSLREAYWDTLRSETHKIPEPEFLLIQGDF